MAKQTNKIVKNYLKNISKELKCGLSFKCVFLKATKEKISEYVFSKDSLTTDDLYAEFGTPQEVVLNLFDKEEYAELLAKAKRQVTFLFVMLAITIVLLIVSVLFINYSLSIYGGTTNIGDISTTYNK